MEGNEIIDVDATQSQETLPEVPETVFGPSLGRMTKQDIREHTVDHLNKILIERSKSTNEELPIQKLNEQQYREFLDAYSEGQVGLDEECPYSYNGLYNRYDGIRAPEHLLWDIFNMWYTPTEDMQVDPGDDEYHWRKYGLLSIFNNLYAREATQRKVGYSFIAYAEVLFYLENKIAENILNGQPPMGGCMGQQGQGSSQQQQGQEQSQEESQDGNDQQGSPDPDSDGDCDDSDGNEGEEEQEGGASGGSSQEQDGQSSSEQAQPDQNDQGGDQQGSQNSGGSSYTAPVEQQDQTDDQGGAESSDPSDEESSGEEERESDGTDQEGSDEQQDLTEEQEELQNEADMMEQIKDQASREELQDLFDRIAEKIESLSESEELGLGSEPSEDHESLNGRRANEQTSGKGSSKHRSEIEKALRALENLNLLGDLSIRSKTVDDFIKRSFNESKAYFSSRYDLINESIFDSDAINQIENLEVLHPQLRKLGKFLEATTKEKRYKLSFNIMIDCSMSMSSGGMALGDGKVIPLTLCQLTAVKIMNMGYVREVRFFNEGISEPTDDKSTVMMVRPSGGTNIERVLQYVQSKQEPTLILTDMEDAYSTYTPDAFFIGVNGANFGAGHSETVEQFQKNKQFMYFDSSDQKFKKW